ncbi:hypothetical protein [Geoalkalibacter sp.]|uniref:hypothetical protein n=1 Tax=Geoalkalibacter sp. TaxID=3041440 RepID=UPI00272E4D8E|nr:hypothetical protein [Geoalkalibacter sp.]
MRNVFGLVAAVMLVAFTQGQAQAEPVESKFKLSLGGYVKLDYVHQDTKLGQPLSMVIPADGTTASKQDESIFTARQTRFSLRSTGPEVNGAKTSAFIEGDFYGGGGTNEAGNLRMRHAWLALSWENTQALFGQFWDIFAPAVASTVDFRSGQFTGNPNNPRVAQARITHNFRLNDDNGIRVIAGLQNPSQNLIGAEYSGSMVNVAAQAMLVSKSLGTSPGYWGLGMNPLTLGFFGLYGQSDVDETAGSSDLDVYGYGAYAFVPVLKSSDGKSRVMTLSLETQAYVAAGLSQIAATAAQTVGPAGSRDAAKGYGAFGQLIFYPTQDLGFAAGYGRRNIMDSKDYTGAAEKYNEMYFGNVSYDWGHFRVAAEYQRLKTQYLAVPTGATGDSGTANVIRLAATYFF